MAERLQLKRPAVVTLERDEAGVWCDPGPEREARARAQDHRQPISMTNPNAASKARFLRELRATGKSRGEAAEILREIAQWT